MNNNERKMERQIKSTQSEMPETNSDDLMY